MEVIQMGVFRAPLNSTDAMVPSPEVPALPTTWHDSTSLWQSAAVGLLCALLTWAISTVHLRFFRRPRKMLKQLQDQGVKGYSFRPILGQIPEAIQIEGRRNSDPAYAASTEGLEFFQQGTQKFGKEWTFCLGPHPCLVITDPALVRQVLVTQIESFKKSNFLESNPLFYDGLFTTNGAKWRWLRRLMGPAFAHKELKRMFPIMVKCAENTVEDLVAQSKQTPMVSRDVDPFWNKLTLDVVAQSVFGSQLPGSTLEVLVSALRGYFRASFQAQTYKSILPAFSYLPFDINRSIKAMEETILSTTRDIISARLTKHTARQNSQASDDLKGLEDAGATDLLELMVNATDGLEVNSECQAASVGKESSVPPTKAAEVQPPSAAESNQGQPKKLSFDQLVGNCITFLMGGHEITANLLTWTSLLLSRHPEWQEKAREEVNAVFDANGGRTPSLEQLSELKTVTGILNESLRLFPPGALIDRTAVTTTKLFDSLTVPEKCSVVIPISVIHRDKELWGEDADQFRPDRFEDGVSKAATHPQAFLPFSAGPRTCIARNFAMAEAKILLALFLRKFKWTLSPGYKHHSELSITLRAKHGLPLDLHVLERA